MNNLFNVWRVILTSRVTYSRSMDSSPLSFFVKRSSSLSVMVFTVNPATFASTANSPGSGIEMRNCTLLRLHEMLDYMK